MDKILSQKRYTLLFSLPALLLFSLFVIYPLIPEIRMSLYKHNGFAYKQFLGLDNFTSLFRDGRFRISLLNSGKMILVTVLFGLPVALLLALLLDQKSRVSKRYFKIMAFLPAVISVTVISQFWIAFYKTDWGMLNALLRSVGLDSLTRKWLSDKNLAIWVIGFSYIWQFLGQNTILLYAAIKVIPSAYFEAATIEGANFRQMNLYVTIPLMREMIKFILITSILGTAGEFGRIKIMTAGGPGNATRTIIYHLYQITFIASDFGKGSAIALVFVGICLAITFVMNKLMNWERIEY